MSAPGAWVPGILVAGAAALAAFAVHLVAPAVPMLTSAVVLGVVVAQIPALRRRVDGVLKPGLALAARRLLRIGIVLLGLKLSLGDIVGLGWATIGMIVLIVLLTFLATLGLGRRLRLPGTQPILIAAGFSICGASAIGAVSAVTRGKGEDAATAVALVTLCGTLAIAVLPVLSVPLGMSPEEFGLWVGLSVHDVGQVVATAQIAGPAALAAAVVVKLTRVLTLAPMVAAVSLLQRRTDRRSAPGPEERGPGAPEPGRRPAIVPLFVLGFAAAVLVRSFLLPLVGGGASGVGSGAASVVLEAADVLQTALFGLALFALGTGIRFAQLARTGWRALAVGLASWALIAVLSLAAVELLA
ncbi:putative sulfate exporter family transporter [Herbiconiux sp. CPCC 203407]|uniref:Sulfate exporter family transporter n=1 Tax=Herbiconiux oxytropis TaxID=2970915 RepID=A0AA41XDI3_9MICO|nr:putative sulfate exporter family transporter [Herbiconiux oxytropis]MCS5721006.1 putative sulfate exporter family transporter [Herbiconiux oxytropis]MCS5724483.1 putative sulfate exporter family transporter [Herbiconiux oxytropis]